MKTTIIVSLCLCAIEFLTIVIASPLAKPSLVLGFLPEDIREAAKDHPEPPMWKQMIAHCMFAAFIVAFVGGIVYLGVDGLRRGYGFWKLYGRFVLALFICKAFDILVQDQWLVMSTDFFKRIYPETADCAGWKDRGFNNRNQLIRIVLYPVLCLIMAWAFVMFGNITTEPSGVVEEATVSTTETDPSESEETVDRNDIYLTLVNPTHKVPDNWLERVELVEAENSLGEKYLVEKETLAHFEDLRNELLEEGIDIEIDSAYRSVEEQQRIWDEFSVRYGDKVGEYVSEPGYSEHHTGLAIDVFLIDGDRIIRDNDDLFAAEDLFAEVHKHLADHGFILSVLPGKEEICGGLAYEPWHFRYVGLEPAKEMAEKGIVLEEYLGEQE